MELEELQKQNEELKARLAKAGEVFKQQKAELEAANLKIIELEHPVDNSKYTDEIAELKAKIVNLENELDINGNSAEEVEKLQERLNKAKTVFNEDKVIKEQLTNQLKEALSKLEDVTAVAEKNAEALKEKGLALRDAVTSNEGLRNKVDSLTDELEQAKKVNDELTEQLSTFKANIPKVKEAIVAEITDLKERANNLDDKLMSNFDIFA